LFAGLAVAAQAQQAAPAASAAPSASGVHSSTDPARADAVEREALDMKARAGSQPLVLFRGKTDAGLAILSGGSSLDDRGVIRAERGDYSLWVATVAKPSGAYLAEVKLRIVHLGDKAVVLERTMEGPWLLAALPAGNYQVSATYRAEGASKDQTISNRVTLARGAQRQVVLRFDSPSQVGSTKEGPF
jgi:hypothetical protein